MGGSARRAWTVFLLVVLTALTLGCALTRAGTKRKDDDLVDEQDLPPVESQAADGGIVQSNAEVTIFSNINDGVVRNGPTKRVEFTLDVPTRITYVQTYHWDNGTGVTPGRIAIDTASGERIGEWQAVGTEGQGGVADAYWEVRPDAVLQPGTYVIVDSDPETQSTNEQMSGAGQTVIRGVPEE